MEGELVSTTLERRATLTERLGVLAKLRRGFQDQQAEGLMTLAELRECLAELVEEKVAISDELRAAEDAAAATRRLQAAHYELVHGEWFEDPGAVQPHEYLSAAASQEEIRCAYNKFGARFVVDADGELTLKLHLDLEEVGRSLQTERTFWTVATR